MIDVSPDIIYEMGLSRKEELSIGEYERVVYMAALSKGYFLLSRRDYTSKELEKKLCLKLPEKRIVRKAVDEIEKKGYIDDYSYAKAFVLKSRDGERKIRYELQMRGVDSDIIEEVFGGIEESEVFKIKKLLPKISSKPQDKKISYLLRRGFGYENVKQAMREYEEE